MQNSEPSAYLHAWFLALLLTLLAGCAVPRIQPELPVHETPSLSDRGAVMTDGYALPLTVWHPVGEVKAVVLALHGYNDYRGAYTGLASYLAQHGIMTYAYDQRGFGATRWRGLWPGTARLTADLRTMSTLVRARHPGVPLYLMGESMGGAVLLASLRETPVPVADGMVLIAPAVWGRETMPWWQRTALWFAAHTVPEREVNSKGLKITLSNNRAMLRNWGRDPNTIKESRFDSLYGIADVMDRALAAASDLKLPALILYGAHDDIIQKGPTCRFFERLPRGTERRWRAMFYPDGYHMLARDLNAEGVLRDIGSWIINPAAPIPSGAEVTQTDPAALPFCHPH